MKERPHQLLREALAGHLVPVVLKAPLGCRVEVSVIKGLRRYLPMSTHDARVEALSRSFKKALSELQEKSELDVSEGLFRDQSWSNIT